MKLPVLVLATLLPVSAYAQNSAQNHNAHQHEVLGKVSFRNSGNAAAQPSLQRGVALLHSFEYQDAANAFKDAQKRDPQLAVAYWLEALSYSHVLWGYEELDKARAALERLAPNSEARLAKAKTPGERAFGQAVEAFFTDATLAVRTRGFADAMLKLAATDPSDEEMSAFAALASMFAWYSAPAAERAQYNAPVKENALRVFRANPQHPGAAHYLIHFVDMNPAAAKDALEFANAYSKIAPDAEHALHMPSHVYLPLGMWAEVAASNERAWAASRREVLAQNGPATDNSWHALDWLQYSYLQLGRYADARALVDTAQKILKDVKLDHPSPDARNAVNLLAFRYGWETGKWDAYPNGIPDVDAMLSQPRPNARAWGMATTAAYQAAVAALRARNDKTSADKVMKSFRFTADSLPETDPRRTGLRRLATQLEAMTAYASGDAERAVALLKEIAPAEPNNASLPPTTIPSYELLGEYLLSMNRKREAAEAFEKVLASRANRAASVRGLEKARAR